MQYSYRIELKCDLRQTDEEGLDTMASVMRAAAQMVLAQATLLSVGRRPQIAVTADNFFDDTQKIALFEDEDLP